ncbi:hypothetical protein, partial [uncultured Desulfovibrio sp.]|uniref:hypothetical protein n=1 Tax=uncultured Desulfovibrio sp. TaxID=167968 RepID=UPI002613A3E2
GDFFQKVPLPPQNGTQRLSFSKRQKGPKVEPIPSVLYFVPRGTTEWGKAVGAVCFISDRGKRF